MKRTTEHTLEYLLAFDGRHDWYEGGYFAKFDIRRVAAEAVRPHSFSYSFTLHARTGTERQPIPDGALRPRMRKRWSVIFLTKSRERRANVACRSGFSRMTGVIEYETLSH